MRLHSRLAVVASLVLLGCPGTNTPPATLEVAPATLTLDVGESRTVTATVKQGDKSTPANGATWTSSDAAIVTVSANADGTATVQGVAAGTATLTARSSDLTATVAVTVRASTATLTRLELTPAAPTLAVTTTLQLTATGSFSDGSTRDVSATATWSASDEAVSTVSASGLVTGVGVGTATVTATLGGRSATVTVTVTGATLTRLEVTPSQPSIAAGTTLQFVATGHFSDDSTQDLSTQVAWASSNTAVATVDDEGLARGVAPGSALISAALDGISGGTTLVVSGATLTGVEVEPAALSLAKGRTRQLTATGRFSDGSSQDITSQVAWSSDAPATLTVSVTGLATAVDVGAATVTATVGGVSGTSTVTVTAAELVSLEVTPATPSLALGQTLQLTATGTYSDATTQTVTDQVTWLSTVTTVATVSNVLDSRGLVTTHAPGTTVIGVSLGAVTGGTTLTVTAAVLQQLEVTPASSTLPLGVQQTFTATGLFSDGTQQDLTTQVTWSTDAAAVATISNAAGSEGELTPVAPGTTAVRATQGTVTGHTDVTVVAATLSRIDITPGEPSLAKGRTQQLTATGVYSDGTTQDLTAAVTWSSAAVSTATVDTQGLLTAMNEGTTAVTAQSGTVSGTTTVTVTAAVLTALDVTPASASVAKGLTRQLTATGTYSDGSQQDLTSSVTWASSAAAVATVSATGLATAVAEGTASLTATEGALSASAALTVTAAEVVSISVTPASPTVAKGLTRQLTATATLSDSNTQDVTATATWASATTSVATVSAAGVVTAVAEGASVVSATVGMVSGSTTVTVDPAVVVSLELLPDPLAVTVGATATLTATGHFSDGTTGDVGAQAAWSSSDGAVATVSAGAVTGVAAGTASITATVGAATASATVNVSALLEVASTTPASGATGVPALSTVAVTFNMAVNPATVTVQSSSGACSGSLQVSRNDFASCIGLSAPELSGGDTVATVTPAPALVFGGSYKVRVTTAVQAVAGQALVSQFTLLDAFTTATDTRCSAGLMISQVYAAGGNSGAIWRNDFVELHNPGNVAVSVAGHTIQYASEAGNFALAATLSGTIPAGGYYLVQLGGGANGTLLPPADATGGTNIGVNGKVALVSNSTLAASCTASTILDLVGGGNANCSETANAPTQTATTALIRTNDCLDTNDNSTDFALGTPAPKNTASPAKICACSLNETSATAELDYCALQFPASMSFAAGELSQMVYAQAYEAGVTEAAGANPLVQAELGFGPRTANPQNQSGWLWAPATFNTQVGNNDEYQSAFLVPAAGAYAYGARFSLDGVNWTYCDLDGAGANAGLDFDPSQLGAMTVTP